MPQETDEVKRIKRIIVGMFIVLLLIVSAGIVAGVVALKDFQTSTKGYVDVQLKNIKVINGRDGVSIIGEVGPRGLQGVAGLQGIEGKAGKDGQDGVQGPVGPQGISGPQGETGATGQKGDTGSQGPKGDAGATVFTRVNPLTGEEECKYNGDVEWQPASECTQ